MCAREQWANKPAQAKTLTFFEGKILFNYFSARQHWLSSIRHRTFSALWSKSLSKRFHVISNWKGHRTTSPPFLESTWLFSNINKKCHFCNTEVELHSLSQVPKIWWQAWHTKFYSSKSMLNTKVSPVPYGNMRTWLFLDQNRFIQAQLQRSYSTAEDGLYIPKSIQKP